MIHQEWPNYVMLITSSFLELTFQRNRKKINHKESLALLYSYESFIPNDIYIIKMTLKKYPTWNKMHWYWLPSSAYSSCAILPCHDSGKKYISYLLSHYICFFQELKHFHDLQLYLLGGGQYCPLIMSSSVSVH